MKDETTQLPVLTNVEKLAMRLQSLGLTPAQIARQMGIHRANAARALRRGMSKTAVLREMLNAAGSGQ